MRSVGLHAATERAGDDWIAAGDHLGLGTSLGRYELRDVLGVGGMALVLEAWDPVLDRAVAIKVLRAAARGPGGGELLRREARTLARIEHPHVVRVHDAGVARGVAFLAMELVRGGTLAHWLERRPRTPAAIVDVFARAGLGLAAAHRAGFVHRDFKPSNVLVGDDERVAVADFGIAVRAGADATGTEATTSGALAGTPGYMAPEVLRGAPVDARTDQYSFCVALERALFGAAGPRADASTSRVPVGVRAALARGLEVEPAARFASMSELLAALGGEDAGGGVRAPAGGPCAAGPP